MQSGVECPSCLRRGDVCGYCKHLCTVAVTVCVCDCHEDDVKREGLWAQETAEQIQRSFK